MSLYALTFLAGVALAPEAAACEIAPPPTTISAAAQETLRAGTDQRFLRSEPQTTEDWIELQTRSRRAGEAWIASEVENGSVQVEWTQLGGVRSAWVRPAGRSVSQAGPLVFNLHGGGYALNGGDAALYTAVAFADLQGLDTVSVDYRLTPQHAWPAALDDAVAAYRALVEQDPDPSIAVYGLSAGGGLAAAFLLRLKELDLPMPAAAVLNSPWSDLALEGDSLRTLDCDDVLLGRSMPAIRRLARFYVGNADPRDPLVSPLHGDWRDISVPVLLISGTRDVLLSDTAGLHRAMWRAGVPAELSVHEAMWHAFSVEPEFDAMIADAARFMREAAVRGE